MWLGLHYDVCLFFLGYSRASTCMSHAIQNTEKEIESYWLCEVSLSVDPLPKQTFMYVFSCYDFFLMLFRLMTSLIGRQAGRQEGRQAGRKEGRQEGRLAGRKAGRQEGRQAGSKAGRRKAGSKEGRQEGVYDKQKCR